MKTSIIKNNYLLTSLSLLSFLALLYIVYLFIDNDVIFPAPHVTLISFFNLFKVSSTYVNLGYTFLRLIVSLVISFMIGGILGILAGKFKSFEIIMKPWMTIMRSVPLASIIVIIMIVVGMYKSPYIICGLMLIPIVYEAFLQGIKNLDSELMQVWHLESNYNLLVLRKIVFPLALPFIQTAFVQSVGLGVKVLVMAEFICFTPNSIGKALVSAANNLEYDLAFAWSLLAILFVLFVEGFVKLINYFRNTSFSID